MTFKGPLLRLFCECGFSWIFIRPSSNSLWKTKIHSKIHFILGGKTNFKPNYLLFFKNHVLYKPHDFYGKITDLKPHFLQLKKHRNLKGCENQSRKIIIVLLLNWCKHQFLECFAQFVRKYCKRCQKYDIIPFT